MAASFFENIAGEIGITTNDMGDYIEPINFVGYAFEYYLIRLTDGRTLTLDREDIDRFSTIADAWTNYLVAVGTIPQFVSKDEVYQTELKEFLRHKIKTLPQVK